jgi:hypothetical protein
MRAAWENPIRSERKNGSVPDAADGVEEPSGFFAAQDDWEFLHLTWKRNLSDGPILGQGVAI